MLKVTNGSQRIKLSRSGTFSSRRASQFHLVLSLAWQNGAFQGPLRLESARWPCMKEGACVCPLFTDRLPKPPNSVTALSSLLSRRHLSAPHKSVSIHSLSGTFFQAYCGSEPGHSRHQLYVVSPVNSWPSLSSASLPINSPRTVYGLASGLFVKAKSSHFGVARSRPWCRVWPLPCRWFQLCLHRSRHLSRYSFGSFIFFAHMESLSPKFTNCLLPLMVKSCWVKNLDQTQLPKQRFWLLCPLKRTETRYSSWNNIYFHMANSFC